MFKQILRLQASSSESALKRLWGGLVLLLPLSLSVAPAPAPGPGEALGIGAGEPAPRWRAWMSRRELEPERVRRGPSTRVCGARMVVVLPVVEVEAEASEDEELVAGSWCIWAGRAADGERR